MIKISSPEQQLRQNRNLLLLLGSIGSVVGLFMWSATPFMLASPKGKFPITLRYLSLFGTLGCGVSAVVAGHQLERIKPLIKAVESAEKRDFLTQLAASQYQQEMYWQHQASQPLQQQAFHPTSELPGELPKMGSDQLPSVAAVSDSGSSSAITATAEHYRPLFQAVTLLQQQGVSDTKIVETVLGKSGRSFSEGKAILSELLQLGNEQNW